MAETGETIHCRNITLPTPRCSPQTCILLENFSDMFSTLYQHNTVYKSGTLNTRQTHEVMLTKLSFLPCYGLLYRSVPFLLLFSVCALVTARWTIICHALAFTLTGSVASVKYLKRWNTWSKSVPNTRRREIVWNFTQSTRHFFSYPGNPP